MIDREKKYEGEGRNGKGKGDKPATSYTFSSIIMYMPLSASLCVATSATEKDFDILVPSCCLFSLSMD
jgi:hypothetical protein